MESKIPTSVSDFLLKRPEKKPKTFVGFKPHPGQIELIDAIENNNKKHTVLSIGRQFGKSVLARNLTYKWAINEPNSRIYYFTPTFSLAKEMFEEMLKEIGKSGVVKRDNKTDLRLTLKNGSFIQLKSGDRPDNSRGIHGTHFVLDEFAFCKRSLWEKAVAPATKVMGKKVLFISSPAGKNHFYELFMNGKNGDEGWQSFNAPSSSNPFIDPNELIEAQKNQIIWDSEYLGLFVDDALTVFPKIKQAIYGKISPIVIPNPKDEYFMGIDLARKHDYTVVTVMNKNKQVVDIYRTRYLEWDDIIGKIVQLYKFWNPMVCVVESNFNDRIVDELKNTHRCSNVVGLHTGPANKPELVQDLVLEFANEKIKIPDLEYLTDELDHFTFVYDKVSGRLRYGAPNGLHDDCPMSLCFALRALKMKHPNNYNDFFWESI